MSVQVSTSIDENTKRQFDDICDSMGVSASNALSMFIKGVIIHRGMPFNPTAVAVTENQENPYKAVRQNSFGCMKGKGWISDDFDEPLDDFEEYM